MFLIDHFRKVSGETVFRELCDIIRQYKLRFDIVKTDVEHKKKFCLPYFNDNDWFIEFTYAPYSGTYVPTDIAVCQNVRISLAGKGLTCDTYNGEVFSYGSEKIRLSQWKKVKKRLIAALDFSIDVLDQIADKYSAWTDEEMDTSLLRFESIRGRRDKQ